VSTIAHVDKALGVTADIGTHECRLFREHIFSVHEFLCLPLAYHYARTAKDKGHVIANQELSKFHKMLTLGKHYHGLFIDSPDEDIKRFAEQKSLDILTIFEGSKKRYKPGYALKRVITTINHCDLVFPLANPYDASPEEVAAAIARCSDPTWWRRQIRNRQDQVLEFLHIKLGRVNRKVGIYASNHCLQRKWNQWERNKQILDGLEAENDLGQVFSLLELSQSGVSNLVNRRNELMARMRGFEEYAKENGDVAVFFTLTAPSKYHSYLSKPCIPNPKYKDYSPSDTQKYFTTNFSRIRAKLNRDNIKPYGFRVVEPHHDGTPHWHILLFMKPHEVQAVTDTIQHYCLQEDGDEPGAKQRRVKVEVIDPNKGSATGYIAKYVAKNIDGQDVGEDNYGFDAIDSAVRIRAWASNWNIRQFQQIGGPSVTVYREARRFAAQDLAEEILSTIGDERLRALIEAADTGNWQAFVAESGGPSAPRSEQPLRAYHVKKEATNKYGETTKRILGLILGESQRLITRIRTWVVRPSETTPGISDYDYGFSSGGANAPPLEFCQ
jgi:hypothetical protein